MSIRTKEEIMAAVVAALNETFGIEKGRLVPGAELYRDLEIDSIDAIDLMVKLQKLIGKRMQPEAFKTVRTIEDVVNVIEKLVNE
ncbi:MAG TPA: acyl carrier protein [Fibrobacteria bacterium]|nr:acyl carrier protein [Fibrobacteria bacterium]